MMKAMWTAIEWTAFGAVLSGIGTVVGALAVICAARYASDTFDGWRQQKLSERNMGQAERILTAAYKARRALNYVRSPWMYPHEKTKAEELLEKQHGWTTSSKKQNLITVQAYYNRLDAVHEERQAVEECLPMARALFGEQVEKALDTLYQQFQLVRNAAEMSDIDEDDKELARKVREDLSTASGNDRPNKMNVLIEEQVNLIENQLSPILRLEAK